MPAERLVHILHVPADVAPESIIYIGRRNARHRLPQSKWANMFAINGVRKRPQAIAHHKAWFWSDDPGAVALRAGRVGPTPEGAQGAGGPLAFRGLGVRLR